MFTFNEPKRKYTYKATLFNEEADRPKNYSPVKYQFEVNADSETRRVKVTVRDNKVIAQLYKKGAEKPYINAVAKCHPIDTFDLEEGIKIAVKRLKEKEEAYNKTKTEVNKHYMIDKRTNERYETGAVVFKGYKVGAKVVIIYNNSAFVDFIKDSGRTLIFNIPLNKITAIRPYEEKRKTFPTSIVDFK